MAVGAVQDWSTIARSAVHYLRPTLLVLLGTVLLGFVLAFVLPRQYRSESRLLALPADYYAIGNRDASANSSAEAFKPEELANVEMQLLSSQDLQRETIRRLPGGAPHDPEALEKARIALAKHLSIERVDGANVIELGYTGGTPEEAQARLQTLLQVYFEMRGAVLTAGQAAMLAKRRDQAGMQLAEASKDLRRFQEQHGIVDIDGQVSGAIALDTALRQDLAAAKANLSQSRGNVGTLRSRSGSVPRTVELYRDDSEATKAVADMQAQVLALEAKKADLQGRYMAGSPLIAQVDKQIAGLRSAIDKQSGQLREAIRTGRNSYYDAARDRILQTEAEAAGQAARTGRLDNELARSGERLRTLNDLADTIAQLKIRRDVAEQRYRTLTAQFDEARAREIDAMGGSTNVRVIQQPSLPDASTRSTVMMLAGSMLAGLVFAAMTLFVLIARRDTFLAASEVKSELGVASVVDLTGGPTGGRPVTALPLAAPARSGRVIAIVAADRSAYGPELGRIVERMRAQGQGHVATVTFEDAAYGMSGAHLAMLLRAPDRKNRITVGSSAWTIDRTGARLLETLRERFAWTIVLIPAICDADADDENGASRLAMAALADETLIVARTQASSRARCRAVIDRLRQTGCAVAGAIVVGRRFRSPAFVRLPG